MSYGRELTRRELLRGAAAGIVSLPLWKMEALAKVPRFKEPKRIPYRGTDDALLEEIERASFDFFWTEAGISGQSRTGHLLMVTTPIQSQALPPQDLD